MNRYKVGIVGRSIAQSKYYLDEIMQIEQEKNNIEQRTRDKLHCKDGWDYIIIPYSDSSRGHRVDQIFIVGTLVEEYYQSEKTYNYVIKRLLAPRTIEQMPKEFHIQEWVL